MLELVVTPHRRFKDAIYEQLARIGKAASAPKRLELLDLLCQGPRTVEALAEQAAISVANTSQHLQVLRAARLVEAEKRGLHVEYRLADERWRASYTAAARPRRRPARWRSTSLTRSYLVEAKGALEPSPRAELARRVRPARSRCSTCAPSPNTAPATSRARCRSRSPELKARLAELPKDRAIVAYCRGLYCVMAIDAVELLQEEGLRGPPPGAGRRSSGAPGGRLEGPR
jgi:DNA-binding transcriptional ArsR family regulator/rhodanese-related sulfurtransferase